MKRLIMILSGLLLILLLVICLQKKDERTLEASCWEQVTDYEIKHMEDGTVSVTLRAPDYTALIRYLAQNGVVRNITVEMLEKTAKEHPDAMKEYSFIVDSDAEELVRQELTNQITYDLMELILENDKE